MNKALVSIIVPAYNAEKYIEECLLSLVRQSWGNLEVIVVDDGSSDRTFEIVQRMTQSYPILQIYQKENGGVSSARNFGLSIAKGAYIAMQDADDISLPERIEQQIRYLEDNQIDLCGCGLSTFGGRKDRTKNKTFPSTDAQLKSNFLFFGRTIAGPALVFRRETAGNLQFNESISYGEDFDFILRMIFIQGGRAGNIPKVLYRYRKHNDQATKKLDSTNRANMIKIVRGLLLERGMNIADDMVACHFDLCRGVDTNCLPDPHFYRTLFAVLEESGGSVRFVKKQIIHILKAVQAGSDNNLFHFLVRKLPFLTRMRLLLW